MLTNCALETPFTVAITTVLPLLRTFTSPVVVFSQIIPLVGLTGSVVCPPRRKAAGKVTCPVAPAIDRPVKKALPSGLTLTEKSSFPAVPISARPENPVWNSRLVVSVAVALFSFS